MMRFFTHLTLIFALLLQAFPAAAIQAPPARIKDIADVEGVRNNMLIGYGLVVGLAGTGDSANSIPFTTQTLLNMLTRLGVKSKAAEDALKTKNIAAVMVTSNMPSFARQGSKLDVTVSSLGDAKSLEGGMLLATPLVAADGETYAVAQGAMVVGGFTAEGNAGTVSKNHPTVARIAEGAVVERETGHELANFGERIRLILRNPDFTTALRTEKAIDEAFREDISNAVDNSTIDIFLPERYAEYLVPAIQKIENVLVRPDISARVIVDEKTGTIVMGQDVRISDVAISHANLTIRVNELEQVAQPEAFGQGDTATVDRTAIEIEEGDGHFRILKTGTTLADVVNGLNALGVRPRDVISILQNIKAAGALQAELRLM